MHAWRFKLPCKHQGCPCMHSGQASIPSATFDSFCTTWSWADILLICLV
jgi:hypothetical protein